MIVPGSSLERNLEHLKCDIKLLRLECYVALSELKLICQRHQGRHASLRSALAPGYLISRLRRSCKCELLSCTSELNPPFVISARRGTLLENEKCEMTNGKWFLLLAVLPSAPAVCLLLSQFAGEVRLIVCQ